MKPNCKGASVMAVRSAKQLLFHARTSRGMTQSKMADGICSLQALSRIECGSSNAGPAPFYALTNRAGFPHTRFPAYTDRTDFACYLSLKYARVHLDAWQLTPAFKELQKVKNLRWADNRLTYQEWLFLSCRLQFRSYPYSHQKLYAALKSALRITRPHFAPDIPFDGPLSKNEFEIITALAQESLYIGDCGRCIQLIRHLEDCLSHSVFAAAERRRLQAESAIVQIKYLLSLAEYQNAFRLAEQHRRQMAAYEENAPVFELTFLAALSALRCGYEKEADSLIRSVYDDAQRSENYYACVCLKHLRREASFPIAERLRKIPKIPRKKYPVEKFDPSLLFLANTGHEEKTYLYQIGNIIRDFRTKQGLSQRMLCTGLCSKSKLSKIESGALNPCIALTEALLQRLGISDRLFTFWGNEKEASFYDLQSELMPMRSSGQKELLLKKIEEMEALANDGNHLWKQACLTAKAVLHPPAEAVPLLMEALRLTLPDLNIYNLLSCRLTRQELEILKHIADLYRVSDEPYKSAFYYLQLLEYRKKAPLDIQMRADLLTGMPDAAFIPSLSPAYAEESVSPSG